MYKCKYCGKEFETSQKLNGHVGWCEMNPNKRDKSVLNHTRSAIKNTSSKLKGVEVACQYCGKLCKLYGLKNHEKYCKENPNRIADKRDMSKFNNGTYVAWNKGLTKDTDERVANNGKNISESFLSGKSNPWCRGIDKYSDERLAKMTKKISNTVNSKVLNDEWHVSYVKIYDCNGEKMQGTWELAFAEFLNNKNIKWKRPKECFDYFWNNSWHKYYPDIYLIDYDVYIEVKGYLDDRDLAKWDQFPKDKKLDIYFGDELNKMNIVKGGALQRTENIEEIVSKYRKKSLDLLNI